MLQQKALIELEIQTEIMAQVAFKPMIRTQRESLAHNLLSFHNDSSKDTKAQREQVMLCGHFFQVPTLIGHFVQG